MEQRKSSYPVGELAALWRHRRLLELKAERLSTLMGTIDRTIRNLNGKEQWQAVKARGEEIIQAFAELYKAGKNPEGPEALAVCARWAGHLRAFYDPTPEMIESPGAMYADHPEFRATYEKIAPGLADWLKPALAACANIM